MEELMDILIEATIGSIERYDTDPEMEFHHAKKRYKGWAMVEIARVKFGGAPSSIAKSIERKISRIFEEDKISLTTKKIIEREEVTKHNVKAFLDVITDKDYSGIAREEASYIHVGLTSYDVIDPVLALSMVKSVKIVRGNLRKLRRVIKVLAIKYKYTLQVFRTHGIHAQPGTFGLKLLRWYVELGMQIKDLDRLEGKVSLAKMSGAVGTNDEISVKLEEKILKELGLETYYASTQIVPRKIHADFIYQMSSIAASLYNFAAEIRHLQQTEIGEVAESFDSEKQTGSSAMPHKRNPISSENICALARLIKPFIITALENQYTWHERDLCNSGNERFIIPYSAILANYIIRRFTDVMKHLRVYPRRMMKNLEMTGGMIYSPRVMLALTHKGMPREEAHKLMREISAEAYREQEKEEETGKKGEIFKTLVFENEEIEMLLAKEELNDCFDPMKQLEEVDKIFRKVLGKEE